MWRNQSSCNLRPWWRSNLGMRNGTVSRSERLSKAASGKVVGATTRTKLGTTSCYTLGTGIRCIFRPTSSLWQHGIIDKL